MVESHTMCNNIQDNAAAQSTGEIIMGRRSRLRMPSNYRRTMKQPLFFCILLCMAPIHQSFSLQLLPIRMKPALRLAFNEGTELSSHVGDSARCPAEAPSSTSSQAPSANSISKEAELETSRLRGGSLLSEMSQDLIRDSSLSLRDISMTNMGDIAKAPSLYDSYNKLIPLPVRYTLSCGISNVLYFGLYWALLGCITSAGIAVTLAYLASVSWQHALHRVLVYGKDLKVDAGYMRELGGVYAAYSAAFVLNPFITEGVIMLGRRYLTSSGMLHLSGWLNPIGFVGSLFITGVLNFFTVSAVFDASSKASGKQR
mmetsp:Transcript_21059/g.50018  ORF Transcript_21059/g.50018 Transcript_21059/m.50018 type:complete len:314 (+) Transcript_21059:217-1158(+)